MSALTSSCVCVCVRVPLRALMNWAAVTKSSSHRCFCQLLSLRSHFSPIHQHSCIPLCATFDWNVLIAFPFFAGKLPITPTSPRSHPTLSVASPTACWQCELYAAQAKATTCAHICMDGCAKHLRTPNVLARRCSYHVSVRYSFSTPAVLKWRHDKTLRVKNHNRCRQDCTEAEGSTRVKCFHSVDWLLNLNLMLFSRCCYVKFSWFHSRMLYGNGFKEVQHHAFNGTKLDEVYVHGIWDICLSSNTMFNPFDECSRFGSFPSLPTSTRRCF